MRKRLKRGGGYSVCVCGGGGGGWVERGEGGGGRREKLSGEKVAARGGKRFRSREKNGVVVGVGGTGSGEGEERVVGWEERVVGRGRKG